MHLKVTYVPLPNLASPMEGSFCAALKRMLLRQCVSHGVCNLVILPFFRLLALVEVYQKAYLLRNKQGGLFSAVQLLRNFLQHLLPENEK